jgi:leucyl aminopeptidase
MRFQDLIYPLKALALLGTITTSVAGAHVQLGTFQQKPILADLTMLKAAQIPVSYSDPSNNLGIAYITPQMELKVSELAHRLGKCGGFESLEGSLDPAAFVDSSKAIFQSITDHKRKNAQYSQVRMRKVNLAPRPATEQALKELKVENLQAWVQWLSAYPSRYNRLPDPNKHVFALAERLKQMTGGSRMPVQIELIDHQSTKQKSIRLTITGSQRPQEVVVFGAHLDSISSGDRAPGVDDNASGSSNLLETLRVVLTKERPQRTLEFYWYAGEESGLLGSAEIAKSAKAAKKNVVAVLQLDMTLFPGEGEFVIGSMTDYTSAWLRDYLTSINETYLKIKILEGQCGYGCSDHASWYRQGYPTLMPFESRMNTMNRAIHTPNDVITSKLNFNHSLVFSKIALVMAMDLANSDLRQPFR